MERKKILWVRLDAIGDTILAASMLAHIYEKFDKPRITVLCEEHTAEIYEASPYVEKVIGAGKMRLFLDSKYRNGIVQYLREAGFDIALDTTCSWIQLSDLFLVGSMAKEKIAFENLAQIPTETMEKRRKVFTRLVSFRAPYEPEMERYRDFLADMGIDVPGLNATIWTMPEDDAFAERLFAEENLVPGLTLALFAFGRSHLRTYPYYGEALRDVCAERGFSVIAFGDGAAYKFNQACLDEVGVRSLNLSGKLTLRQTAAVMRKCRMAVGAETGLAHMACAVDIPNVIVIGGGHLGRFMPYTPKTSLVTLPLDCFNCDWSCRYEKAHCVMDVDPSVIEYAVRQTLESNSTSPRLFVHPAESWEGGKGKPSWRMVEKFIRPGVVEVISPPVGERALRKRPADGSAFSLMRGGKGGKKPLSVTETMSRVEALRDEGRIEDAIDAIESGLRENPGYPDLMNLKAELILQGGNVEAAKEILWEAVLSFPFDTNLLNNISVIEVMQGRHDSALGMLQRVLEIEPKNETALSNLQYIQNEIEARTRLVEAEESILMEDYSAARKLLAEILAAYPSHEDALCDLAVVEAREGNTDAALRYLQRVLGANQSNEYAVQLMEKLLLR